MPSPFPGMDPYLEDPTLWPHVHLGLIMALHDDLGPRLRPKYYVAACERTYLTTYDDLHLAYPDLAVGRSAAEHASEAAAAYGAGRPGARVDGAQVVFVPVPREMREGYLEIRRTGNDEVVAVIEVLSPGNKRPGEGRDAYATKRERRLAGPVHLVEIDLLRCASPMPMAPVPQDAHYRILVSRAHERPKASLYAFSVREAIPEFPVPLDPGELEPTVRLGPLLAALYERAGFDLRIDYSRAAIPPLGKDDEGWAAELVAAWRQQTAHPVAGETPP